MKVIINAILSYENPRGVGVYIDNIIKNLVENNKQNQYVVYYGKWMYNGYNFTKLKHDNLQLIEVDIRNNKITRNLYQLIKFPFMILKHKPDLLHIPDTSPVLFKTTKIVSTIHDLAEFDCKEKYSNIQVFFRRLIVKLQAKYSDKIITVSEYSKNSMIKNIGVESSKIKVVYNGVDIDKFKPVNTSRILLQYGIIKDKYILFVGEIEKTKNVGSIIKCLKKINSEYKYVVCGRRGNDFKEVENVVSEFKMKDRVIFTDYVSSEGLLELYSNAFCFVFPSSFEGFGLPLLEAMSMGIPVISSNKSCLPEVGGDSVLYFNPDNYSEFYEVFNKLNSDSSFRKDLILSGYRQIKKFNWIEATKKIEDVYNSLK